MVKKQHQNHHGEKKNSPRTVMIKKTVLEQTWLKKTALEQSWSKNTYNSHGKKKIFNYCWGLNEISNLIGKFTNCNGTSFPIQKTYFKNYLRNVKYPTIFKVMFISITCYYPNHFLVFMMRQLQLAPLQNSRTSNTDQHQNTKYANVRISGKFNIYFQIST